MDIIRCVGSYVTCLTLPSPCSSIELCNCWVEMTFPRSPITVELLKNFSSEQRDSFSYRCFSEELFILEEWRNLNISAVVTKLWRLDPKPSEFKGLFHWLWAVFGWGCCCLKLVYSSTPGLTSQQKVHFRPTGNSNRNIKWLSNVQSCTVHSLD